MRTRRRDRDAREASTRAVASVVVEFLVVAAFERESRDAVERDALECDATRRWMSANE